MNKNFVNSYVVFDTETTGLDNQLDKIIEIGALKYIDNELVDTFDVLINPEIDVPSVITSITGITNEMVMNEKTIEVVIPQFIDFVGELPVVAHNALFDMGFINANLEKYLMNPFMNETIDTVELAREYIPKAYNYKLATLKNYFKLDFGSHRSVDDCQTTNYVYQECKKRASARVS